MGHFDLEVCASGRKLRAQEKCWSQPRHCFGSAMNVFRFLQREKLGGAVPVAYLQM
jgi:hypothetical protein